MAPRPVRLARIRVRPGRRRDRRFEERAEAFPAALPGRIELQVLAGTPAEVLADRGVVCPIGVEPGLPARLVPGRIGVLAEHPQAHRPDAAVAVELHAARDPLLLVTECQDVPRFGIQAVNLAPDVEVGIVREGIEHPEGRQPEVAGIDLPYQRRAVVRAGVAAGLVAVDGTVAEDLQGLEQRRGTGLVEADAEDLAAEMRGSAGHVSTAPARRTLEASGKREPAPFGRGALHRSRRRVEFDEHVGQSLRL